MLRIITGLVLAVAIPMAHSQEGAGMPFLCRTSHQSFDQSFEAAAASRPMKSPSLISL